MKHTRFLLAFVTICFLSLSSCKQSTDNGGAGGAINSGLTATVNGAAWIPTFTSPGSEYINRDTVADFTGGNDTSALDIQIWPHLPFNDTGTYSFQDPLANPGDTAGGTITIHGVIYEPVPKSGTIHLSVWTPSHVTASFNFKAKDSKGDSAVVTNGQLDMSY